MNNSKPFFKRLGAYIIDVTLVLIISSLISSIPFLNKDITKYQETYKEYETEYNKYMDNINLLNESYKDNELSEEEFNKFSDSLYKNIIEEKYDDKKITKEEHQEIIESINKDFDALAKDYIYLLNKCSITNTIITLVCTLLYFGVLQYFLKGQTIGKKILKIQVVSATDKKLNVFTYILRSLIINDILLNAIGTVFLIVASKKVYTEADSIIGTLISIVEAIIIFMVITREDARGLHDVLFGTKVVSTVKMPETKEEKIIEINEETKQKKKTTKKNKKKIVEAEYKEKK